MSETSIFVTGAGTSLGKRSRRLVIKHPDRQEEELSLLKIKEITIMGLGITISSDLIAIAIQEKVQINLVDSLGRVTANILAPYHSESIRAARAQLKAAENGRGIQLARAIIVVKINNQINLLQYLRSFASRNSPEIETRVNDYIHRMTSRVNYLTNLPTEKILISRLLAAEGISSNCYWLGIRAMIGPRKFPGRQGRGANDPINSLLNYGYAILQSQVLTATLSCGLLPFAGFIHQDRSGKPSLVLDLMELFRQPAIDYSVVSFLDKEQPKAGIDGKLETQTLRKFSSVVRARLDQKILYSDGKWHQLQAVIKLEIQQIASFLKEDRPLNLWTATE